MANPQPDTTHKLMRLIGDSPTLSQREIAEALRISLGLVNRHLNALIDKGFVKAFPFKNNVQRRAHMYMLTLQGFEERLRLARELLEQKELEQRAIKQEIETLRRDLKEYSRTG